MHNRKLGSLEILFPYQITHYLKRSKRLNSSEHSSETDVYFLKYTFKINFLKDRRIQFKAYNNEEEMKEYCIYFSNSN